MKTLLLALGLLLTVSLFAADDYTKMSIGDLRHAADGGDAHAAYQLGVYYEEASSTTIKQAAVWIYTDKPSFSHVNEKFTVSQSDWDAATAIVKKCSELKKDSLRSIP